MKGLTSKAFLCIEFLPSLAMVDQFLFEAGNPNGPISKNWCWNRDDRPWFRFRGPHLRPASQLAGCPCVGIDHDRALRHYHLGEAIPCQGLFFRPLAGCGKTLICPAFQRETFFCNLLTAGCLPQSGRSKPSPGRSFGNRVPFRRMTAPSDGSPIRPRCPSRSA
jgi:hypothetical protein